MYVKIIKVATKGKRGKKDNYLRPIISGTIPKGVNYVVLEYVDDDANAIVKVGADTQANLDKVAGTVTTHADSEKSHIHKTDADKKVLDSSDATKIGKTLTYKS